jgi:hypothetical protein
MNLVLEYIDICRRDPTRMEAACRIVSEEIDRIIESYTGSVNISYRLMMDMVEITKNYLIKKEVYDLFRVLLEEVDTGWTGRKIKVHVRYTYNEFKERTIDPGVYHKFYRYKGE